MLCKFMRWQYEASLDISLDIIVFTWRMRSSLENDDALQFIFNCKKSTTAVTSETCDQVRFFWDRGREEFLCHLIFKVSCSVALYIVKIGCDIRILLMRTERKWSGHQSRIRWSRCERVRQQNISRQINHESVRIELSSGTTLSMIYAWDVFLLNRKLKRNEKCYSCSGWHLNPTMKTIYSDQNAKKKTVS